MMIPALLSCPPVSSKGKRHYANMAIERIAYGDEGSAQWENRWGVISPQRSEVSASAGRGGQSTQVCMSFSGLHTWGSAVALAHLIARLPSLVRNRIVVELGSICCLSQLVRGSWPVMHRPCTFVHIRPRAGCLSLNISRLRVAQEEEQDCRRWCPQYLPRASS